MYVESTVVYVCLVKINMYFIEIGIHVSLTPIPYI